MKDLIVQQVTSNNLKYRFAMGLTIVLCALLAFYIPFRGIGIVLKILLILGAIYFLYVFADHMSRTKGHKNLLTADVKGITDNTSAVSLGFVPWSDIERIYVIGNGSSVEVTVKNPEQYASRVSGVKAFLLAMNRKLGHSVFSISVRGIGIPAASLCDFLKKKRAVCIKRK